MVRELHCVFSARVLKFALVPNADPSLLALVGRHFQEKGSPSILAPAGGWVVLARGSHVGSVAAETRPDHLVVSLYGGLPHHFSRGKPVCLRWWKISSRIRSQPSGWEAGGFLAVATPRFLYHLWARCEAVGTARVRHASSPVERKHASRKRETRRLPPHSFSAKPELYLSTPSRDPYRTLCQCRKSSVASCMRASCSMQVCRAYKVRNFLAADTICASPTFKPTRP